MTRSSELHWAATYCALAVLLLTLSDACWAFHQHWLSLLYSVAAGMHIYAAKESVRLSRTLP